MSEEWEERHYEAERDYGMYPTHTRIKLTEHELAILVEAMRSISWHPSIDKFTKRLEKRLKRTFGSVYDPDRKQLVRGD